MHITEWDGEPRVTPRTYRSMILMTSPVVHPAAAGASFVPAHARTEGSSLDTTEVNMVLGSLAATLFTLLAGLGILL
ncbi:hypothetical protein JQ505_26310 [Rhodococcus aetherivorans]|nr:hypothetical protein [Rhodococcus aetherivorans]AKE88608.1 hypothetical protein AAT18_04535 [Rhodococcus aetherivorans]MDV6297182.1 hypothetical protein [Rhodococcus aetherivorans]NCL76374.1 hypothetical protein [Rhodococcus sp. YH1]QRI79164.1 hypothetical protein JQ505_26310 [Rhodococcus aetherivorans]